ncbi:vankyrin-d8.2 [Ichnoviriform fugitivi]|uniref:Vankyrin-d8.2 n=1 Tax=Ichnoviriform fugitivi TaxID=265522 RepID=A2Q0L8_9VIRU|nr:vankyrin-d8.2 [Ichnoviriform fugitivi]BAF45733.1 vankyrin-d8.2 [Ichnoviriform fugitivi]
MSLSESVKLCGRNPITGNTIFHEAAKDGSLELLYSMRDSMQKPYRSILRKKNKDGETCLHVAVKNHTGLLAINLVKVLVELGADLNAQEERSHVTVLFLSVCQGDHELAKWLCWQPGINWRVKHSITGNTIFHEAAKNGALELLHSIRDNMQRPYRSILGKNKDGQTCIHVAVKNHTGLLAINLVKVLVELGADLNAQEERSHVTVLFLSVCQGDHELAEWLCWQPGINWCVKHSITGNTIFHEAAKNGALELLHSIRDNMQRPYRSILGKNKDGQTCIHVAVRNHAGLCAIKLVKVLLELGADLNAQEEFSLCTALFLSVYQCDHELTVWLCLRPGINWGAKNWDSMTVFDYAYLMENERMLAILLEMVYDDDETVEENDDNE